MMMKRQKRKNGDEAAPAAAAPAPAPARFERPQLAAPEVIAVIAALLEIEARLNLGAVGEGWTFPAAAGHGWSETGRQLVAVHERGTRP